MNAKKRGRHPRGRAVFMFPFEPRTREPPTFDPLDRRIAFDLSNARSRSAARECSSEMLRRGSLDLRETARVVVDFERQSTIDRISPSPRGIAHRCTSRVRN